MFSSINVSSKRRILRKWEKILKISQFLVISSIVILFIALLMDRLNSANSLILSIEIFLLTSFLLSLPSSLLVMLIADIKHYFLKNRLDTWSKEYKYFSNTYGHYDLRKVHTYSKDKKAIIYKDAEKELESASKEREQNANILAILLACLSIPIIFLVYGYFLPDPISHPNSLGWMATIAAFLFIVFQIIFSMPSEKEKFYQDLLDKCQPRLKKKK
jgi:ABC-type multidrug transport system fused ATPase/permease subunit